MTARAGRKEPELLSFATAPALYAAVWLSTGILVEPWFARHAFLPAGGLILLLLLLSSMAALAAARAVRVSLAPLACTWIVLGWMLTEIAPAPAPQTQIRMIAEQGGAVLVEGTVARAGPVRFTQSSQAYSSALRAEQSQGFDLRIDHAAGQPVTGGLRATAYGALNQPFPAVRCGDHVQALIAVHLPQRYLDPGVWDATEWLRQQGIGVVGSLKASTMVLRHESQNASLACRLHALQEAGSQRLLDFAAATASSKLPQWLLLNQTDAGMLSAMVLGDRTYLEHQARVGFERTGSFHLLVVSGMHLAIFAGCIVALAARLRFPRAWSTCITIVCSYVYALLAGFGEPVQRSFWMVTLYLLARLLFRQRQSLNAIGFAAVCLLAVEPRALLGASFQMTLLSVLIVGGVVLPVVEHTFGPYLRAAHLLNVLSLDPKLPPALAQFRVTLRLMGDHLSPLIGRAPGRYLPAACVRWLLRCAELVLVSALIELAMSLPMAMYFHRITALGLPVNLIVVPLIAVALPSALLTFCVLLVSPSMAVVPATMTAAMLHFITFVVSYFSAKGAGDIRIASPGKPVIVAGVLLIAAAVWCARNSRYPVLLPIAALACSAACVFYPRALSYRPGVLEVTALDVGQGDSLLLISPDGKTMLVDSGGPIGGAQNAHGNFEIGEDVVSPVLWSRNIQRLDAVALSHAHSDHMGGMPAILENFRPRVLYVGNNPNISDYAALLATAARLGIVVESKAAGDHLPFGTAQVEVVAPPVGYVPGTVANNDDSLVLRVIWQKSSVLLEGDAQLPSERQMLTHNLRADLLKVGHHGSKTSTSIPFLQAVSPSYAIISAAHRNPFGHPKWDILDRLQKSRVRTYRTDSEGATTFYLDGNSVTAKPLAAQ